VNGRQIKSVDTGESRKEVTPQRTLIVSGKRYQNRKGLKKRAKWCDAARHDYRWDTDVRTEEEASFPFCDARPDGYLIRC
jgi:hypothetical protein